MPKNYNLDVKKFFLLRLMNEDIQNAENILVNSDFVKNFNNYGISASKVSYLFRL